MERRLKLDLGCSPHNSVHRAAVNLEDFSDLRCCVLTSLIEADEVGFLELGEFGLLSAEPALGLGDLHAFTGPSPYEVGFTFGNHGQDVEQQSANRIRRIVDGSLAGQR
jgi:hypothetical protein